MIQQYRVKKNDYLYAGMTNRNKNIDSLIERVLLIFFFLFILSVSSSDSNSQTDTSTITFEQVTNIDNSAILTKPVDILSYNISIESCELINSKIRNSKFDIDFSNNTTNLKLKSEGLKFFNIKPKLIKSSLIHFANSCKKEYPLIS
jgi:hypothetical protein